MAQDYILRLLQQIGAMLAGIVNKRQQGDLAGAEAELQEQCLQRIGLPLFVVKHSPPETVAELLAAGGELKHARGVMVAELLLQDAAIAEARGNPPEALIGYRMAFRLLTDALPVLSADDEKHYRAKLRDIATKLSDLGDGSA